jgi:hypothetical protein
MSAVLETRPKAARLKKLGWCSGVNIPHAEPGKNTSGAAADAPGREHRSHCDSVLLADGGIQGGAVDGASLLPACAEYHPA